MTMAEIGESSTPNRVTIIQDDEQPGTSRERRRSSVKVTTFQVEELQINNDKRQDQTPPPEIVERTWKEEKARRSRVRRIYGTDMCQNDGEIKREKGITRTLSDLSEKRIIDRRKRLTRKLSDLVLVKSPELNKTTEVDDVQDSKNNLKIHETIEEIETVVQKDTGAVVSPTPTIDESVNEPSPAASVNAMDSSKQDGNYKDEVKPSSLGSDQSTINDNFSEKNEENFDDVEHETTVDVHCAISETLSGDSKTEFDGKSENTNNTREEIVNETAIQEPSKTSNEEVSINENNNKSIQTQSQDDVCSEIKFPPCSDVDEYADKHLHDNHIDVERNVESEQLENGIGNFEVKKPTITLRDLYREIKLMRQVVAAVALPELNEVNVDSNISREKTKDTLKKETVFSDDTNNNSQVVNMVDDSEEADEIEKVQKVNSGAESLPENSENSNRSLIQEYTVNDEESKDTDDDVAKTTDSDNNEVCDDGEVSNDDNDSHGTSSQIEKDEHGEFNNSDEEHLVKDNQSEWGSIWSRGRDRVIKIKNEKGKSVIGCILHFSSESFGSASVECNIVDPAKVPTVTALHENLISNIIQVSPLDGDDQEEEITIGVPFLKHEMKYFHESCLRVLELNSSWQDGFFAESVFQRDDEVDIPVLLTSMKKSLIFAVVARPVTDSIVFTHDMTTAYSSVDRDIYLSCPTSARINTMDVHVQLKVLPVCPDILEATKEMFDDDIRRKLFSAGAVVKVDFIDDPQTVFVHMPCMKPPSPSRPVTGGRRVPSRLGTPDSGYRSASRRSAGRKSAFGRYIEPSQEKESHLVRFSDCMTTKVKKLAHDDVTNDDKVTFTVLEKTSTSVVVDVTKGTKVEAIEDVVEPLMYCLEFQNVLLCIAHHKSNLNELSLICDKRSKVDSRKIFRLERDHNLTKSIISIKEGATICLHFRGNIAPKTNYRRIFKFYGVHGVHASWKVGVVDPYGQRTLDMYCGFLQVFMWNSHQPFLRGMDNVYKYDWKLILEVPISLPKPDHMMSSKINRAPITLKMEGPISAEFLEYLSRCIGDEWPLLAKYLRVEHPRLQAIMQQNRNHKTQLIKEVLLTWFKRSLVSKEKASTLIHALRYSGREDLSEQLKDSYRSYKHERTKDSKDQRLDKILFSVCKSELVTGKWSELALELGLYPEEISNIENVYHNDRIRCEQMLMMWKSRQNGHGFRKLVKSLRQIGRNAVADYLVSLVSRQS